MRTYILDLDPIRIPGWMSREDQIKQTHEAEQVIRYLFRLDVLDGDKQLGLPVVAMWGEYPFALLDYFAIFVQAVEPHVSHYDSWRWKHLSEKCWEAVLIDTDKSDFQIINPIRTLATERMVRSHLIALTASNPKYYTKIYPYLDDLSVPFMEEWG